MKYGDQKVINQEYVVPDNTVLMIPIDGFDISNLEDVVRPMVRKRDWFDKNFYYCMPLSMANQQGWSISLPYDIRVVWDGNYDPSGVTIESNTKDFRNVLVKSHFPQGTFTIKIPIIFRTPPGISMMIMPPSNYCHENLSTMSGIVETDNLRFPFSVTIKIPIPNHRVEIPANTPLATIVPIERGLAEKFSLKPASDIFDDSIIKKELEVYSEHLQLREYLDKPDRLYFSGQDLYGNKFKNHIIP